MFEHGYPNTWSTLKKLIWLVGSGIAGGAGEVWKTASGAIASFETQIAWPLRKLEATIDPIQDLHGYDSPWPAGGGKNKFFLPDAPITIDGVTVEGTSDGEIWVHGTPAFASDYKMFCLGILPESLDGETVSLSISEKIAGFGIVIGSANGNLNLTMSDTVTSKSGVYTAGGTRACYINIRYDIGTVDKKFKIQLEVNATPTAWSPYENLCPISGRTGCNVSRTGKNLLGSDTLYASNTLYSTSGSPSANNNFDTYRIKAVASQPVTLSGIPADSNFIYRVLLFNSAMSFVSSLADNISGTAGTRKTATVTPSSDGYILVCARKTATDKQVELGSATAYSPYVGTTYPFPLGQTVYGGTLDVLTGVLTVTDANIASYNGETLPGEWISDRDVYAAGTTPTTGAQVVYKLAQPQTYQLDPVTVQTLLGKNNVWADCGDVEVEYRES